MYKILFAVLTLKYSFAFIFTNAYEDNRPLSWLLFAVEARFMDTRFYGQPVIMDSFLTPGRKPTARSRFKIPTCNLLLFKNSLWTGLLVGYRAKKGPWKEKKDRERASEASRGKDNDGQKIMVEL